MSPFWEWFWGPPKAVSFEPSDLEPVVFRPPAPAAVFMPAVESGPDVEQALQIAVGLCRQFEGFYPKPYLCPAGVPTIGFGTLRYEDGTRVTLRDPAVSLERALALLTNQLRHEYLPAVLTNCPGVDTTARLAALLDFTYNLGGGNLKASTLRKRVNAKRWDEVPAEFRKWVKGGGKVLRGLVLRREAEIRLFDSSNV